MEEASGGDGFIFISAAKNDEDEEKMKRSAATSFKHDN